MSLKLILATTLLLFFTASAAGQQPSAVKGDTTPVITWKGGRDRLWSNPQNWDGGRVPGASDVARFAAGSGVVLDAGGPGMLAGLV